MHHHHHLGRIFEILTQEALNQGRIARRDQGVSDALRMDEEGTVAGQLGFLMWVSPKTIIVNSPQIRRSRGGAGPDLPSPPVRPRSPGIRRLLRERWCVLTTSHGVSMCGLISCFSAGSFMCITMWYERIVDAVASNALWAAVFLRVQLPSVHEIRHVLILQLNGKKYVITHRSDTDRTRIEVLATKIPRPNPKARQPVYTVPRSTSPPHSESQEIFF